MVHKHITYPPNTQHTHAHTHTLKSLKDQGFRYGFLKVYVFYAVYLS